MIMNEDIIKGRWKQIKGSIKQQWGQLTDDDLTRLEGDRDYLLGKVQERYGISKEKAEEQIREFERRL
jgi:uncharacterized protein YjbJ (UPF0337 family)